MKILPWLLRGLVACALLASSGCYKATFHKNQTVVRGTEHEHWSDYFVFGLVNSETVDTQPLCGDAEVAAVRTGGNFATGLLALITIGIYTPRKVYVTCAAQGGAAAAGGAPELAYGMPAHDGGKP